MLTPEFLVALRHEIASGEVSTSISRLRQIVCHMEAQQARIEELEKKYLEERDAYPQERDKCEKLEQDAARYRWLREQYWS